MHDVRLWLFALFAVSVISGFAFVVWELFFAPGRKDEDTSNQEHDKP